MSAHRLLSESKQTDERSNSNLSAHEPTASPPVAVRNFENRTALTAALKLTAIFAAPGTLESSGRKPPREFLRFPECLEDWICEDNPVRVIDAFQQRLDKNPKAMRLRRETAEHPFGTLKMPIGATDFLMKGLPKVATEMSLHVLAYNLTRAMNISGVKPILAAIQASRLTRASWHIHNDTADPQDQFQARNKQNVNLSLFGVKLSLVGVIEMGLNGLRHR
jgi:hypothetical protein